MLQVREGVTCPLYHVAPLAGVLFPEVDLLDFAICQALSSLASHVRFAIVQTPWQRVRLRSGRALFQSQAQGK